MTKTIEFRFLITNSRSRSLQVVLEPWGDCHPFEPGDQMALVAIGPEGGHPEIDYGDESITYWGWTGSTIRLLRNGRDVDEEANGEREAVPDMSGLNIAEPRWK